MRRPRLLYLVTEDWFFHSHFLDRALHAHRAGLEVAVATRIGSHAVRIRESGIHVFPLAMHRGLGNPISETRTIATLVRLMRAERPDIVHNIALKPIVLGSAAARIARVPAIVNAPVGMGYVFTSTDRKARWIRPMVSLALQCLLNPPRSRVIFENAEDLYGFTKRGAVKKSDAKLIRGAGVDLSIFCEAPEPTGTVRVLLCARMLVDKGIREYVTAARLLKSRGVPVRFVMAGGVDPGNPASIATTQLEAWSSEGVVDWLGHRSDIQTLLAEAHIVCLPSYREGLPKALLEALAVGRPVVTTDVPGCREVVRNGDNGLLVPARDAVALAAAIERLVGDPALRARMGGRGRERAENEFSNLRISEETVEVYRELIGAGQP